MQKSLSTADSEKQSNNYGEAGKTGPINTVEGDDFRDDYRFNKDSCTWNLERKPKKDLTD